MPQYNNLSYSAVDYAMYRPMPHMSTFITHKTVHSGTQRVRCRWIAISLRLDFIVSSASSFQRCIFRKADSPLVLGEVVRDEALEEGLDLHTRDRPHREPQEPHPDHAMPCPPCMAGASLNISAQTSIRRSTHANTWGHTPT